jgi:hypothetical protein
MGKEGKENRELNIAKGAGQVRKIEMQIFQVKNKEDARDTLIEVKEDRMDHAIALNEKLSIINKA